MHNACLALESQIVSLSFLSADQLFSSKTCLRVQMTILLLSANGLWSAHWLLFCSQLDNTQIIFQSIKAFSPGNGGAFGEAL